MATLDVYINRVISLRLMRMFKKTMQAGNVFSLILNQKLKYRNSVFASLLLLSGCFPLLFQMRLALHPFERIVSRRELKMR